MGTNYESSRLWSQGSPSQLPRLDGDTMVPSLQDPQKQSRIEMEGKEIRLGLIEGDKGEFLTG